MKRSYTLFLKYLVSYIIVLLLPMIVLNGIYSLRVNKVYRTEVLANMQTDLNSLALELDAQISSMSSTINQLSAMLDFNTYRFEENPLYAREIKQLLQMYCSTSTFADEIILYMHNDDYLVSSTSTSLAESYARWIYRYKNSSPEQMLETFRNVKSVTLLPNQPIKVMGDTQDFITVLFPVYTDYQTIKGTCIFFINGKTMHRTVKEKFEKYDAGVYISAPDGEIIYSNGNVLVSENQVKLLSEQVDNETVVGDVVYKNPDTKDDFFVHSAALGNYGFRYTAFIPQKSSFATHLDIINSSQISGTIIVILISMALIFILMLLNYSPIRKLREKAVKALPVNEQKTSELETISSSLDFLAYQNEYLTTKLESNFLGIKNVRLQELLTGRFHTLADFNAVGSEHHLFMPHNYFAVSCVLSRLNYDEWETLAEEIKAELPSKITSYYVYTVHEEKLYFIHSLPQMTQAELTQSFEAARCRLEAHTGLTLTIGIGSIVSGTDVIPKSFLQAGSALDYRFVKGNGNTISYSEIASESVYVTPYPRTQFKKLKNAVLNADDKIIEYCVNEIADYIDKNNLPLFAAKGLCFDIISLFLEHAPNTNISSSTGVNLLTLTDVDTAREVVNRILEIKNSFHKSDIPNDSDDADKFIQSIILYINEHCMRCDFSIQETSIHFNMMLPNLSQFFKDKTGQTILDYSTNIRMKRAKKLLLETETPLKELGYQVGYYNVSSFIRRFKQTQGVTPGDYRRLHGKSDSSL